MKNYKISLLVDEEWLEVLKNVTNVDTYDEVCTWLSVEEDKWQYMDARLRAYDALAKELLDSFLENHEEAEVERRLMSLMQEEEA
jgi:hypothetical protein